MIELGDVSYSVGRDPMTGEVGALRAETQVDGRTCATWVEVDDEADADSEGRREQARLRLYAAINRPVHKMAAYIPITDEALGYGPVPKLPRRRRARFWLRSRWNRARYGLGRRIAGVEDFDED